MPQYSVRTLTGLTTLTQQDDLLVIDFDQAGDGFAITLPTAKSVAPGQNQSKGYYFVQRGQPASVNCTPVVNPVDTLRNVMGYIIVPPDNPRGVNIVGGTLLVSDGVDTWYLLP